ncbi:hypothetical protein [Aeoliella sp.]|uniref:hypothetical protein n=1 Tax=Aeoliella sp. TaxID=2795800 RepID=UPI003CCB83C8
MTPDEFAAKVLPAIEAACQSNCLCAEPGFRKLLSFDFDDYGTGPVALADSEIVGDAIVLRRFKLVGKVEDPPIGFALRRYECPQCGAVCVAQFDEYSISMNRTVFRFESPGKAAESGLYLVGFRGFKREDFAKVTDFERTESQEEFLRSLGVV